MSRRRVVVTGLGIIAPVGIGVADAWANIVAGRSGIGPITRFDASTFPSRIAGEVKDFDVTKYLSGKEARRYDTFIHYGLVAAMESITDAGLDGYTGDKERVGVCIGSGIGGLPMIEETHSALPRRRTAQDLAVLRSRIDHQHDRRTGVDPLRLQGPEPGHRQRVLDRQPQHRRGRAAHRIRRRRHHGGRRFRVHRVAARHRRILRVACAVDAQRRPGHRQPPVGRRSRRLCAGRGRRRAGARGTGAREGPRRAHPLRAHRLRDERGCAPHHGPARRWRWRAAQHGQRAEECRDAADGHRLHQRARHVDAAGRRRRDARRSSARSATTRRSSPCRRPSR